MINNVDTVRRLLADSSEALQRGAPLKAVDLAREAVDAAHAGADRALEVEALEALGAAMWARGESQPAARVLGAADLLREQTGHAGGQDAQLTALAQSSPGWAEGRGLSTGELLAWLSSARDRRGRPTSGWESLTTAERRVAELVAEGLSNPDIAEKLFLSRNTVKAHLRRVYLKLGATRRSDLLQGPR